ncbi:uncharacterized protein Dwil_GK15978 [Drosophila willistoni]|uniref:Uncharacterized protein n=1 Tax=Drosophila willistoni TaxID=7260 RepID=B4MSA7_DROWI|nr:uncharacterized protein LOC6640706 [Drosophila willistoni]EDW74996.2 uncharacterized protein Dwil_GK15978 [Drosophila willistoni]
MAERMAKKFDHEDRQNFVSTPMSLPLFMVSRNRIRAESLDRVKKQFHLAGKHYNKDCQNENRGLGPSAATLDHYRHVTGHDKSFCKLNPEKRTLRQNRDLITTRDWQMAPNRYGIPPIPYQSRMGSKGTLFPKQHIQRSRVVTKPPQYTFYELPSDLEKIHRSENRHKGVFLSNARERRPTSRNMVSSVNGCWRDPTDPGPCDTHTYRHELWANVSPVKKSQKPNPHLFLRNSCVPTKPSTMIKRHISFEPGPGRYETRYANVCPCPSGKINMPELQLKIDAQKRLKFRRLPFKRINPKTYCEPDWRHVPGAGHEHIFRMGKHDLPPPKTKLDAAKKQPEKHLNLFADGKYLNMLNNPTHHPISFRDYPLPTYEPKIVYNCVAKRVARKQLRNNKKIAFNSGQERWKDGDRPLQLTTTQIEAIKESLPPERRLVDNPIQLRRSRIISKLFHVPEHQKVTYLPKLRKRLFKFLPIPGARVLVTDSDIRPDITFDPDHPTGMYRKKLDEKQFFLDSVLAAQENAERDTIKSDDIPQRASTMSVFESNSDQAIAKTKNLVTVVEPNELPEQAPSPGQAGTPETKPKEPTLPPLQVLVQSSQNIVVSPPVSALDVGAASAEHVPEAASDSAPAEA